MISFKRITYILKISNKKPLPLYEKGFLFINLVLTFTTIIVIIMTGNLKRVVLGGRLKTLRKKEKIMYGYELNQIVFGGLLVVSVIVGGLWRYNRAFRMWPIGQVFGAPLVALTTSGMTGLASYLVTSDAIASLVAPAISMGLGAISGDILTGIGHSLARASRWAGAQIGRFAPIVLTVVGLSVLVKTQPQLAESIITLGVIIAIVWFFFRKVFK